MNQHIINTALLFAAKYFNESCHNTGKPVYLHSLRVAQSSAALGYGDDVIVGAILHDLLEDTDCTAAELEAEFSSVTARCVEVLTYDASIPDKFEKNRLSIDACAGFGAAALVIKCLDTMDNMDYFNLAGKKDKAYLLKKYEYLRSVCETHIPAERAYSEYKNKLFALLTEITA